MPTEKILTPSWAQEPEPCRDPDHGPAPCMAREPGFYEHRCPACGLQTIFSVREAPKRCACRECRPKRSLLSRVFGRA